MPPLCDINLRGKAGRRISAATLSTTLRHMISRATPSAKQYCWVDSPIPVGAVYLTFTRSLLQRGRLLVARHVVFVVQRIFGAGES